MWPIIFALIIVGIMWGQRGFPLPKLKTSPPLPAPMSETQPTPESKLFFEELPPVYPPPSELLETAPQKPTRTDDLALKPKLNLIASGVFQNDPQKEYIEIAADYNNKEPARITGLDIQNKRGLKIKIPKGVTLPYLGMVNFEEDIFLKPGEKAILITGKSPVGMSFRLNSCTGYFEEWQDFTPSLRKECPDIEDETAPNLSDKCLSFVRAIPVCQTPQIPWEIDNDCRAFINERANYAYCVKISKSKPDFYKRGWRVWLSQNEEIWSGQKDAIKLINEKGEAIVEKNY